MGLSTLGYNFHIWPVTSFTNPDSQGFKHSRRAINTDLRLSGEDVDRQGLFLTPQVCDSYLATTFFYRPSGVYYHPGELRLQLCLEIHP